MSYRIVCSLLLCTTCWGALPETGGVQLVAENIEFYRTVGPDPDNVTQHLPLTAQEVHDDDHNLDGHWHPLLNHDEVQLGCHEVRREKLISNGQCQAVEPITEVSCSGNCLPIKILPWYSQYVKIWASYKLLEWRCVDDLVTYKNMTFKCKDGMTVKHLVKVAKGCKCKRYHPNHNAVLLPSSPLVTSEPMVQIERSHRAKGKHKHRHRKSKSRGRGRKRKPKQS